MALIKTAIPSNSVTPPTDSFLVVSASASGTDDIDAIIHFTKPTIVVAALGIKPALVGSTLQILINPHPEVWGANEMYFAGVLLEDAAEQTIHLTDSVPIIPPGYLRLQTLGAVAGEKRISLYVTAYNAFGGPGG